MAFSDKSECPKCGKNTICLTHGESEYRVKCIYCGYGTQGYATYKAAIGEWESLSAHDEELKACLL